MTSQLALAERLPVSEAEQALMETEGNFGWLAGDVSRLMRTIFDRRVKALGLTRPQWLALVRLRRRPGASQSELADMMEIERAPAGKIVDRLEERGWLERRPDPEDRRINRIFLTDRGDRVHATIWPIAQATVADALVDLSDNEITRLTQLMTRVKTRLGEIAERDRITGIEWADDVEVNDLAEPPPP